MHRSATVRRLLGTGIFWQEFSHWTLYLEGKSPLLMSNIQVNFGHTLPETSKRSAFWDMGVDSHLKWLLLFSPNELASWDGTSIVGGGLQNAKMSTLL